MPNDKKSHAFRDVWVPIEAMLVSQTWCTTPGQLRPLVQAVYQAGANAADESAAQALANTHREISVLRTENRRLQDELKRARPDPRADIKDEVDLPCPPRPEPEGPAEGTVPSTLHQLQPCPFCGQRAHYMGSVSGLRIVCGNAQCGVQMVSNDPQDLIGLALCERWNRRPVPSHWWETRPSGASSGPANATGNE